MRGRFSHRNPPTFFAGIHSLHVKDTKNLQSFLRKKALLLKLHRVYLTTDNGKTPRIALELRLPTCILSQCGTAECRKIGGRFFLSRLRVHSRRKEKRASFFPCLHRIASMNGKESTLMFNYNYQAQHDYKPERTQPPVSPKSWEERWFSVAGDLDDFIFYDPTDRSPAGCSDR